MLNTNADSPISSITRNQTHVLNMDLPNWTKLERPLRKAKKALQNSTSQVQWAISPCVSELSFGKLLLAGLASEIEGQTSIWWSEINGI